MIAIFFLGVAVGALLAIPAAAVWSRRTAKRVRQLEQRARTAERLAELGTLTGGLAHEIKNPLSTIGLNIQLLSEDLQEIAQRAAGDEIHERVARLQRRLNSLGKEASRLREILDDFLRFAGRLELDLVPTNLNAVIDELADFFEPQAREANINIRSQLTAAPAVTMADQSLLKQAVLNLLINATQAMTAAREKNQPHGGANELILRTERAKALDGEEILIHVIDTGPGIPEDVAAKIFQPYFSTKRGGTGLGLPTTRRIIEEHGGRITVHGAPGRGSDFTIALPAHEEKAA